MSSLTINEVNYPVSLTTQATELATNAVTQSLTVQNTEVELSANEYVQSLSVRDVGQSELEISVTQLGLEIIPDAVTINQYYSGGAHADGTTIDGDGSVGDPFRIDSGVLADIDGKLTISERLGEFVTQAAKDEAVLNLGLNVIDGGTF